ncbi:hypothetical protein PLESTB_000117300 [Pleodorina starrii]|uniref:Transaldolase n=1 Tax=Pleodorina starrii TaxID=330485 RepID=A0A9W6EXU5_9CHLO|nr:hypothetical protein PLESTM_000112200 [Pleodorina starrii]GLC48615.1 hypothetical protein PLESTB_000117300 [Pleodorina starrii]GLC71937.1 hypothetical protein PLESTF_001183000 [Pleodorina starrii]
MHHQLIHSSVHQRALSLGRASARRTRLELVGKPCHADRGHSITSAENKQTPQKKPEAFTKLRLFIDSANLTQWELWLSTNLFYGITTNPCILEKDGQRCTLSNLTRLCRIGEELGVREMQFQAWGDSAQSMVSVALDIFGMNPNLVVVKLPCTLEGFQAAALLQESAVRVTMTAMYTSSQILLAQSVGAEYAAPYLGRMNDAYGNNQGYKEVAEMQRILTAQKASTRLLVASVRDTYAMASLAAEGCDTFTISPAVASKLFAVSYTLDAVEQFEASARRMGAYDQDEGATTSTLLGLGGGMAHNRNGSGAGAAAAAAVAAEAAAAAAEAATAADAPGTASQGGSSPLLL